MSYLNPLRVHFAGTFTAKPSTVNNLLQHYDNAQFAQHPEWQQTGPGGWNPGGDHSFTLDCPVTAAYYADGTPAAAGDAVLTLRVSSRGVPAAKLVDLDPDQQGVSMIFGLSVVIGAPAPAAPLLQGSFLAAPFTDLWRRGVGGAGDPGLSSAYQSVLQPLTWGDVSGSRFLQALKAAAGGGLLSIKFNVDGYHNDPNGPSFTTGRLVGTIGPADPAEPLHFVRGRQFNDPKNPPQVFFLGVLDETGRKVWLDLGNALPASPAGGPTQNIGTLGLVCQAPGGQLSLGNINYTSAKWYENTAGVVAVPPDRQLTDAELAAARANPLALIATPPGGAATVVAAEAPDGSHLRADMFVARMNPGDTFNVRFYASRFGKPLGGATIGLAVQGPAALTFPANTTADANGNATVAIVASDPGNPRRVIDGQVYTVGYSLNGVAVPDPSDALSIHVYDAFTPDNPTTWYGSMQPILQQYANLYPVMMQYVDLSSYQDVSANAPDLITVLTLDQTDAGYMPVTRDLSEAKRQAMVQWLRNVGPDGNPLLGTPPPAPDPTAAGTASKLQALEELGRRGSRRRKP
jgi:hypothetical protein